MLLPHYAGRMVSMGMMILGAGMASGQDFPTKPLRILTQPTGGGADFAARLIAAGLTSGLGQQVIVDNRAGTLSLEAAAKAPPDGYTLLLSGSALWLLPLLRSNVPYDPVRDFATITCVAKSPNVLLVHPSLPVKSVKELIALARSRPGELNYSSAGGGTPNHLAAELFKSMANVKIVHIPYKGTGEALTSVLSGEVQLAFPNAAGAGPIIRSGRAKALAITTAQESALYPGLPTVSQFLPGYESVGVVGMFAPAKTPATIINRLNQEIVRVLKRPDVIDKFQNNGIEVSANSPQEFAGEIKVEVARWGRVIKEAGIRID